MAELLKDPLFDLAQVNFENNTCAKPWLYAHEMLQKVSRTFALNIGVLPRAIKQPVLLAYLFCRIADTIEDDFELSPKQKELLLNQFSALFDAPDWALAAQVFTQSLPPHWAKGPGFDQILSYYVAWPLELLYDSPKEDLLTVRKWVQEMSKGMIQYSNRRPTQEDWFWIQDLKDMDQYCYYVAGTVGFMLCDLFYLKSTWITKARHSKMTELANSFGLGLQVTNIIKDIREDFGRNTSFIPKEIYDSLGIQVQDILQVRPETLGPMILQIAHKALNHLRDAKDYTLLIPRLDLRIRLFCLWPLFLALATLQRVVEVEPLSENRVKISRAEVKDIIAKATKAAWSNKQINQLFNHYEELILKALKP